MVAGLGSSKERLAVSGVSRCPTTKTKDAQGEN